jgi:cytochrome c biogenesis protein CcmG/thiol:disulfide interchange protein DsbE
MPPHPAPERVDPRWLVTILCSISLLMGDPAIAIEPGTPAPDFSLPKLDGSGQISLSSYRGKLVYVDFWASWCAPCLNAIPALEAMRAEFPESKFEILAINLDRKVKKAQKFLEKREIGYASVSDPKGMLPKQFGLETMPTSYLIDQSGIVRYVHRGFRDGDIEAIRREIKQRLK